MRLLHIITCLNNGGAEAVLYRLITADKQNSHQVISLMGPGLYGERLRVHGIPVHSLHMPRGWVTPRGLLKLYRLIHGINPDVIQTWMYHADLLGGIVAWFSGKREIVWNIRATRLQPEYISQSPPLVVRLCIALSNIIPKEIVVNSVQGWNFHSNLGYPDHKMIVVPNGFALSQLKPDSNARMKVRDELGMKQDYILLGMVARWDLLKDHANLLAAISLLKAEEVPNWRCVLIGPNMDGNNTELSELLKKYRVCDRVILIGPRSDIPAIMNALDLHVLSSVVEAFPNVVAEAMACGTPGVVTDVGDAAYIVGETGWVVPASNPQALASALRESRVSFTDQVMWSKRKAACRERILENFSLERMVSAYSRIWQRVLEKEA